MSSNTSKNNNSKKKKGWGGRPGLQDDDDEDNDVDDVILLLASNKKSSNNNSNTIVDEEKKKVKKVWSRPGLQDDDDDGGGDEMVLSNTTKMMMNNPKQQQQQQPIMMNQPNKDKDKDNNKEEDSKKGGGLSSTQSQMMMKNQQPPSSSAAAGAALTLSHRQERNILLQNEEIMDGESIDSSENINNDEENRPGAYRLSGNNNNNRRRQIDDDDDDATFVYDTTTTTTRNSSLSASATTTTAQQRQQQQLDLVSTVRATAVDEEQLREAIIEEFVGGAAQAVVVGVNESSSADYQQQQHQPTTTNNTKSSASSGSDNNNNLALLKALTIFCVIIFVVVLAVVLALLIPGGGDNNNDDESSSNSQGTFDEQPSSSTNNENTFAPNSIDTETRNPTNTPTSMVNSPTQQPSVETTTTTIEPSTPPFLGVSPVQPGSNAGYCNVGGWTNPIEVGQCVTGSNVLRGPTIWNACGYTVDHSTWYAFNGTGTAVTASTCNSGTNFNTRISVFQGGCDGEAIVCAGTNNDSCGGEQSSVTFDTQVDTLYYVGIDGVDEAKGNFAFSVFEGTESQTQLCTSPTCRRHTFCDILDDIFVDDVTTAWTTDEMSHMIWTEVHTCGRDYDFDIFNEIKGYRFYTGNESGDTIATFCNLDDQYTAAIQVLRGGCDGGSETTCPYCHAATTAATLSCADLTFRTEANMEYYIIVTAVPAWWGPVEFSLTLSGNGATTLPPAAAPTSPPTTTRITEPFEDGLCGCTCEVDAHPDIEFGCRHLRLSPEINTDMKCMEYCSGLVLTGDCANNDKSHILTCPADHVWTIHCSCLTDDFSCEVTDSSIGEKSLTQDECSAQCAVSSEFGTFCNLSGGSSYISRFTTALSDTVIDNDNIPVNGFGVDMCSCDCQYQDCVSRSIDDLAIATSSDIDCQQFCAMELVRTCGMPEEDESFQSGLNCLTLISTAEESDSSCGCFCSVGTSCLDSITGISSLTTQTACSQYCTTISPCAEFDDDDITAQLAFCS